MKKTRLIIAAESILLTIFSLGCADQLQDAIEDYCALNYQNCKAALDTDECLGKSAPSTCDVSEDTPDCLIGDSCPNLANEADAYAGSFNGNTAPTKNSTIGYVGVIDKNCHKLNSTQVGGDVDIIPIMATPGTALKVRVFQFPGSKIKPMLYLRTRAGHNLIYSRSNDAGMATLSFIAPDELFYVSVEETSNAKIDYSSDCDESNVTGGEKYKYIMEVLNNSELSLNVLGSFTEKVIANGHFSESGQSHYYKFSLKPGKTPTITVQPAPGSPQTSIPVISPLSKNFEGATSIYSWLLHDSSLKAPGVLGDSGFDENYLSYTRVTIPSEYAECDKDYCKYIISISDYNGYYDYDYQLSITE